MEETTVEAPQRFENQRKVEPAGADASCESISSIFIEKKTPATPTTATRAKDISAVIMRDLQ